MPNTTPTETIETLRTRVTETYQREFLVIRANEWESPLHRARALNACKRCKEECLALLTLTVAEEKKPHEAGEDYQHVFQEIKNYVEKSVSCAYDNIRNAFLRLGYIKKLKELVRTNLTAASTATGDALETIAKQAVEARNAIMEATRELSNDTSRMLARLLKEKGLTWEELFTKYKERLSRSNPGASILDDLVNMEIIKASGRHNSKISAIAKINGFISAAMLIILLTITILEATFSDAVGAIKTVSVSGASILAGVAFERVVAKRIVPALVRYGVAESAAAGIAFVSSVAGSIAVGAAVGYAADKLFDMVIKLSCGNEIPAPLWTAIIGDHLESGLKAATLTTPLNKPPSALLSYSK